MLKQKAIVIRPDLKKYFEVVQSEPDGKSGLIKCLHVACKEKSAKPRAFTARQGWSTHVHHLEQIHNVNTAQPEDSASHSITSYLAKKKPLQSFSNKNAYSYKHSKQLQFMTNMKDLVCIAGVPLNLIEHPIFMQSVRCLDNSIRPLPSRSTLARNIKTDADSYRRAYSRRLKQAPPSSLHFSFDLWSSRNHKHVMGIMVHYVDDFYKLNNFTLGFVEFPEKKESKNIRETFLRNIFETYGISPEQIGFIMTDNAQENVGAFGSEIFNAIGIPEDVLDTSLFSEGLDEENDDINWVNPVADLENDCTVNPDIDLTTECDTVFDAVKTFSHQTLVRLGCTTHALQLVVKECLKKNPGCKEIIAYVSQLITFFNHSNYWHSKLVNATNVGLIKIGDTRWNGFLLALQRILRENFITSLNTVLEEAHNSIKGKNSNIPELISPAREAIIIELSNLLSPFLVLTNELQSAGVTSSLVILGIITLYKQIAAVKCQEDYMQALRSSLCLTITERFGAQEQFNYSGRGAKKQLLKIFDSEAYILATVLDPRWKLSPFEIPLNEPYQMDKYVTSADKAKQIFRAKFEKEKNESCLEIVDEPHISTPKRAKEDFLSSYIPADGEINITELDSEIDQYFLEKRVPPNVNPLDYYRSKMEKNQFPILQRMARRYLGFPASSSSIERVFSISGTLNRARRARLTTETMENMLICRDARVEKLGIKDV